MPERRARARHAVPRVDTVWLRRAIAMLARDAVDTAALLRQSGLPDSVLEANDTRVRFDAYARFVAMAAEASERHCFGVDLAEFVDVRDAGLLAYVVLNSSNVAGALENLGRYLGILTEGARIELLATTSEPRIRLRPLHPSAAGNRHLVEFACALVTRVLGSMTRRAGLVRCIRLPHGCQCPDLGRRLGADVEYDHDETAVVLADEVLEEKVTGADPHLLAVLQQQADRVLEERLPATSFVQVVRELVLERLSSGTVQHVRIAQALGMSPRTLTRRLADEGTTLEAMVDHIRRDIATGCLADPAYSLGQIAYLLGYSELAAFTRAFKRWTGEPPSEYRRKLSAA